MAKKTKPHHRSRITLVLYGALTAILLVESFMLATGYTSESTQKGQLVQASPVVLIPNPKVYADPSLGFALQYPSNWGEPQISRQTQHVDVYISKAFHIILGSYFDPGIGRTLTLDEVAHTLFGDASSMEDIHMAGVTGKRISFAGTSNFSIVLPKPMTTDEFVVLNIVPAEAREDVSIIDRVLSTFTFLRA